jgi:hypothetical protein
MVGELASLGAGWLSLIHTTPARTALAVRSAKPMSRVQIAAARVPVVAMVSCNPVTFARDARSLIAAGYALDWVQVVDQFRWSAHVELAARLSLPHIPAKARGA